jgi:tetratricopeptide (TPR) repeat protein
MNLLRIVLLSLAVCAVARPLRAEYQVGDTVVVVHDAKIKVQNKVVQEVRRGVGLKVQAVEGDWLWVSNQGAGWLHVRDVATPTDAIASFSEQIKKDPRDSDAFVCRGLAWLNKQEVDIAIADFNEAIRMNHKNASAYGSRAICWWTKREVDKAIADDTEAIRLDPREPMYLANRGILWNMRGDYEKAVADADAALLLNPSLVPAHIVRGNALVRQRDYARAVAAFEAAIQVNPRDAALYGLRGRVLAAQGDYEAALQDFDKALKLNPKDRDANNEIARFYAICPVDDYRDGDKAVEYARRACELSNWRWASSIGVLAAAYAEQGDFEQAIEYQTKATNMVEGNRRDEFEARLKLLKAHRPLREMPVIPSRVEKTKEAPAKTAE